MSKARAAIYLFIILIVTGVLVIPSYSGISPNLIANSLHKLSISPSTVVEPIRMLLLGTGLIGLGGFGRRRMKRNNS